MAANSATKPGEISLYSINNPPTQPPDCVISISPSTPNETLNSTVSSNRPPQAPTGPGSGLNRRPKPKPPVDSEAFETLGAPLRSNSDAGSPIHSSRAPSMSHMSQRTTLGSSGRKMEAKDGPDEREVYRRVTAQLSARKNTRMTVKFLIQFVVFLAILSCLICSFTVEKMRAARFCGLKLWKWFVLLMVIFSGMLITQWFVHLVVFFIEWKFIMKKNVVYFTHGLKTSVEVFIWIAVVLATWVALFKPDVNVEASSKTRRFLDIVTWTIASLLIGSFLWLLKNTLLKLLASSFHLNRFFGRIQESVYHHYVLQVLSGRPVMESTKPAVAVKFNVAAAKGKGTKVVDLGKLHQMKKDKVPSYTVQLLVDVVANSGLSTMSGMLEEDHVEGGVELDDDEITSEEQAIVTAVGIFENVVRYKEDPEYIDKYDLMRFMIEEEVDYLLPLLEPDDKGQISLTALTKWVVKVFKDRQLLQHALNDNKTAVRQLNKIVSTILIVICFVLWLLLTEIASTKLLLFFSSQLVVAAFVFGNTCKTIFEAIIFVFVMHPFDVGDRCVIDGTRMIVEEMNILTTVLLKTDKEKVYYPNSQLSTKPISNFYRSPENQGDTVEFSIDFMTPLEKIGKLKERINKYLLANPHFWAPDHNLVVREIENVNKIKMCVYVDHTMNFQEYQEKLKRKSELVLELKQIFEDLQIKCNLLPQEVILNGVANATSH